MQSYTTSTFNTLMEVGFPVCLWGNPGVGKSARVGGLDPTKYGVITVLVSTFTPSQLTGIHYESGGEVKCAKPHWLVQLEEIARDGRIPVLFLDELNTAPQMVQAPALRIVAERVAGQFPLPGGCRVVAAINPPEIAGGALSEAMLNRFAHLEVGAQEFLPWLLSMEEGGTWDADRVGASVVMRSFLEGRSDLLVGVPTQENPSAPSPRVWERAVLPVLAGYMAGVVPPDALIPALGAACGKAGTQLAAFVLEDAQGLLERALRDNRLLTSPPRGILFIRELLRTEPSYLLKTYGSGVIFSALEVAVTGRPQALPLLAAHLKAGVGWAKVGDFTTFVRSKLQTAFQAVARGG